MCELPPSLSLFLFSHFTALEKESGSVLWCRCRRSHRRSPRVRPQQLIPRGGGEVETSAVSGGTRETGGPPSPSPPTSTWAPVSPPSCAGFLPDAFPGVTPRSVSSLLYLLKSVLQPLLPLLLPLAGGNQGRRYVLHQPRAGSGGRTDERRMVLTKSKIRACNDFS